MSDRDKVFAKLFIGVLITSEVKMHLNQSSAWQNAQVINDSEAGELVAVRFHDNDYLGCYAKVDKLAFSELKSYEKHVFDKLQSYCPDLQLKTHIVYFFSQIFIH